MANHIIVFKLFHGKFVEEEIGKLLASTQIHHYVHRKDKYLYQVLKQSVVLYTTMKQVGSGYTDGGYHYIITEEEIKWGDLLNISLRSLSITM